MRFKRKKQSHVPSLVLNILLHWHKTDLTVTREPVLEESSNSRLQLQVPLALWQERKRVNPPQTALSLEVEVICGVFFHVTHFLMRVYICFCFCSLSSF